MKIHFLWLGKSKQKSFQQLLELYQERLKHYCNVSLQELREMKQKGLTTDQFKDAEAELFINQLSPSDYVILLDERGKQMTSIELSNFIQHKMNISINRCVFVIAGAYGASQLLKDRSDYIWSLSHLTLTHDMARVLLIEQIYRGYTILKGEKYHNE